MVKVSPNYLYRTNVRTPELADKLAPLLNELMPEYGIDTPERVQMFLAQIGHESASFTTKEENLNYSHNGLLTVLPKYYKTEREARLHARKPELIANKVYGGRMGNTLYGFGYKYRGRGFIQLTGFDNYAAFERDTGLPVTAKPDLLLNDREALLAACWFWKKNNLNRFADKRDIVGCTRAINGGLNGFDDRKRRYRFAQMVAFDA